MMAPAGRRPPPQTHPAVSNLEAMASKEKGSRVSRLLNPMSLLARRRTSHAVPQLSSPPNPPNTFSSPTDADPSIRGTKVHDFDSTPRPRRNVSHNDVYRLDKDGNAPFLLSPNMQPGDSFLADVNKSISPWSGGDYTPVFTEDFEEEQYPAAGPHVRKASDLSDLTLPKLPFAPQSRPQTSPSSAEAQDKARRILGIDPQSGEDIRQRQPSSSRSSPENQSPARARSPVIPLDFDPPANPVATTEQSLSVQPTPPAEAKTISIQTISPPRTSPASIKTRSRNVSGASTREFLLNGVKPRHMKSTSSRFSFDMIGAANQEKLLEDRHRQKEAEKQQSSPIIDDGEFDDFDYDCMIDDGIEEDIPMIGEEMGLDYDDEHYAGLEEDVPLVGEYDIYEQAQSTEEISSTDEDEESPHSVSQYQEEDLVTSSDPIIAESLGGFIFSGLGIDAKSASSNPSPMSPRSPDAVSTPRDVNGDVIGFALSQLSSPLPDEEALVHGVREASPKLTPGLPIHSPLQLDLPGPELTGLGLQGVSTDALDEDDMYFDDGTFDHVDDSGPSAEFDESVFDNEDTDQYGRPLRDLSLPTLYSPPLLSQDSESSMVSQLHYTTSIRSARNRNHLRLSTGSVKTVAFETTGSIHKSSIDRDSLIFQQPALSLTHDTLNAYQSALAAAAQSAAANGRFDRSDSICKDRVQFEACEDFVSPASNNQVDLSSSQPFSKSIDDYDAEVDDFDYDDALDDDAIIAEANAEALANDSDGFYGQEFGFYSNPIVPHNSKQAQDTTSEASFGGFFGPRGADGLLRTKSGRVVREPNLTPITERSEYSNRNSLLSLPPSSNGWGIVSPGLAQLASMGQWDDSDMSLTALMKMRRGAWGGSQASMRSSNGEGSPLSAVGEEHSFSNDSLWSPSTRPGFAHMRRPSAISIGLSETSSAPASPTATLANMAKQMQFPGTARPLPEYMRARPLGPASPLSSPSSLPTPGQTPVDQGHGCAFPQRGARHRHTGSADSVSYIKEDDPKSPTGERWVLERRRTAESGEIEVLGRQVVSGGRI